MISPILDRARACLITAMNAGKMNPGQIDRVLLVGGTTYIPAVREMVADFFGREPKAEVPPDLAVAMGAAVRAAQLGGHLSGPNELILADVCPMGLGIDVLSPVAGRWLLTYSELISLVDTDQSEVRFCIFQDRTGRARVPADALPTGLEGRITGIPPSVSGEPHPLVIDFRYDANGEICVEASIPSVGVSCRIEFERSELRMSPSQIAEARARMDGGPPGEEWSAHPSAEDLRPILEKARELLNQIPEAEGASLARAEAALREALAREDRAGIESARATIVELLYDFDQE
jgi:molecular chaperone DnaK